MQAEGNVRSLNQYSGVGASLVAQMVKCLPAVRETWVWSLGREDSLEKEMATHPSTLAWKIPWMEEPGRRTVHGVAKNRTWLNDFIFFFFKWFWLIGRMYKVPLMPFPPVLWPPDAKNWLIGKDPDAGRDWRLEEKGTTEDEMVGWHHWFDGHEFEQALGIGDGQGSLPCCSPWGHKELDMTNWTELYPFPEDSNKDYSSTVSLLSKLFGAHHFGYLVWTKMQVESKRKLNKTIIILYFMISWDFLYLSESL